MSIHRLVIEMLGRDKASDDFKRVRGEADKMAKSFGSLEGVLGAAGVAGFAYMAKRGRNRYRSRTHLRKWHGRQAARQTTCLPP